LQEYEQEKDKIESDFAAKMAAKADSTARANSPISTKSIDTIIAVPQTTTNDTSTNN
jgi:hypothetical protein